MPSVWEESFGLVAAEAMVNGIPVVASNRGAIPETLGHGGVVLPIPAWISTTTRQIPTRDEIRDWIEC
jgi:glycosyltransferase involved in cell wall biosynthesis